MTFAQSLIFTALLATGTATAQTAAPAAPTASVTATASCPKPDDHPGRLASDNQRRGWGKEVQTWTECMKKYIAGVQAAADEAVKTANAAVARSNAAVSDYNAIVKELQAQADGNSR